MQYKQIHAQQLYLQKTVSFFLNARWCAQHI